MHPPPAPAWAYFTLMMECTPEKSSRCYSVYSVVAVTSGGHREVNSTRVLTRPSWWGGGLNIITFKWKLEIIYRTGFPSITAQFLANLRWIHT